MEILNNFGFDIRLFIAQVVNFLILAFVFKRFLYKPLLKVMKERETKINKGLSDAEKAAKALESANTEREKILQKASKEAEKILDQTRTTAEEMRTAILTESKKEAEKIIEDAKTQARLEFEKMQKDAKIISLSLSERILENVIKGLFTPEEQNKILKRSLERIKKYD